MVAEAIASALPEGTPCRNIRKMNESLSDYDCVFMGFWVDKGTADDASRKVLENLHNPQLIEAMYKRFPADNPHGRNPESEARHKEASTHPDAADLENAAAFARNVMNFIQAEK